MANLREGKGSEGKERSQVGLCGHVAGPGAGSTGSQTEREERQTERQTGR